MYPSCAGVDYLKGKRLPGEQSQQRVNRAQSSSVNYAPRDIYQSPQHKTPGHLSASVKLSIMCVRKIAIAP